MSELPRFNQPFTREGSPTSSTSSPPRTPKFSPRLLSFSNLPRRLSLSLSSENSRKSSVASFHGDLITEKKNKQRRKVFWKVFKFLTIFALGLVVGVAIGCWAVPQFSDYEPASSSSSPFEGPDSVVGALNVQARETKPEIAARKWTSTAKAASSTSIKTSSSSKAAIASTSIKTSASNTATAAVTSIKTSASSIATAAAAVVNNQSNNAATGASSYWKPTAGTTWQIQIDSVIKSTANLPANISVYDTDLFDTPASTIAALQAAGKKVICYFSAGTVENWRSDYSSFLPADIGGELDGWQGENWLDTTSTNVRNIMAKRIQLAKTKGCDGIDPDNMDVYTFDDSGFTTLTTTTAINYMQFLATTAHNLGMAAGLKNAGEIINSVVSFVDYSVSESCVQYNECSLYQPFITAGKPAFAIQYPFGETDASTTTVSTTIKGKECTNSKNTGGFSNVLKHYNLDAWLYTC